MDHRESIVSRLQFALGMGSPLAGIALLELYEHGDRGAVKGRKRDRVLVLNHVAQSIVEARRGRHPTHVFAFRALSNTAWQKWRREAGKEDPYHADLREHDLWHTVGMRLREANVP
jgi:hypothetical protein